MIQNRISCLVATRLNAINDLQIMIQLVLPPGVNPNTLENGTNYLQLQNSNAVTCY